MKLCIDCVFFVAPFCSQSVVARQNLNTTVAISPVDGSTMLPVYPLDRMAMEERKKGRCGMEAKLFQLRPFLLKAIEVAPTVEIPIEKGIV